jgi:hypothetical protein
MNVTSLWFFQPSAENKTTAPAPSKAICMPFLRRIGLGPPTGDQQSARPQALS